MPSQEPFNVAIIGGGLCGLALAIALRKKDIPFKIYEARSSFTELGAGINVGPNSSTALCLIDPDLQKAFFQIARQNPPGKEHVYLDLRLGAPSGDFQDGEIVETLLAPPTGNTTVGRDQLLQMLAERAGLTSAPGKNDALFNKKVTSFTQDSNGVTLTFSDTTTASASVVIASDGIHSTIRRLLLSPENPASKPTFSGAGAYRSLLPTAELELLLGQDRARSSQAILGPGGYIIYYPVSPTTTNIGFWTRSIHSTWSPSASWLLPAQGEQMRSDFAAWGDSAKKLMKMVLEKEGDQIPFWSAWHHAVQPSKFHEGRVIMIGDAAHAMPPHAGAGAGQAMEDAFLMAEVLAAIHNDGGDDDEDGGTEQQKKITAALEAYESVRSPRSQAVLQASERNFSLLADTFTPSSPLTHEKLEDWRKQTRDLFHGIWRHDLEVDAARARERIRGALGSRN